MDAPCLRKHLCKPRLCGEHLCPCVPGAEWGPKIKKQRAPKKSGVTGELEEGPSGFTCPGVFALLAKASRLLSLLSIALLTSLFSFPPPLPLRALSLSTQSCCVPPHCSLTNSQGQTTFHTQSREQPLPGWHPDLIIDYLLPWVLFPESLIWGSRGDKRLSGALEAKWPASDQQQMVGCWAKATDTS